MASGAAALNAAAAVAVFAVLVMSSQGHPKTGPLCSDCVSLCSTNCTAYIASSCREQCDTPSGCQDCKNQVLWGCQDCCSKGTCSCDCNSTIVNACRLACSPRYASCQSCRSGITQTCYSTCNSDCNNNCVKKDHGC
ncbi:uncharacterized protein LOC133904053 [Phragmites australis]|uniref:uncharacterized protein LOC133904053 n=1 Tax=Phragmites australis TaxID=29695 RepID=UPI002D765109|nr:uncharacterized protein LOC133904053 [Phragmites australis]